LTIQTTTRYHGACRSFNHFEKELELDGKEEEEGGGRRRRRRQ
jgi:hypothetical protein